MPEWLAELSDLTVIAGKAAIIPFGDNVNMFGEPTQVTVDFGFAEKFTSYSSNSNSLRVYEGLSSVIDVG